MDFLQDALASGRKVRTLSIEDAYTREMLAIEVDTSLPSLRVVRVLEKLRQHRGLPVRIVIDNGTEFTAKALDQWAYVLSHGQFALLARPRVTSRATDSLYLFESRPLGLHGLLMMRQSEEGKWSIFAQGNSDNC